MVVISNEKEVLIRCGAIQILAQPKLFRGILKYPTVWRARSVVTFRFQRLGKDNSGLTSRRNWSESVIAVISTQTTGLRASLDARLTRMESEIKTQSFPDRCSA